MPAKKPRLSDFIRKAIQEEKEKEHIRKNSAVNNDMAGFRRNGRLATTIDLGHMDYARLRSSTEMDAIFMVPALIIHLNTDQDATIYHE